MSNHPITPPPELVSKWANLFEFHSDAEVFTEVARWGADQELDACCEWLVNSLSEDPQEVSQELRAARRPKPPSLKEQALGAFSRADKDAITNPLTGEVVALRTILSKEQSDTIRKALEALPND